MNRFDRQLEDACEALADAVRTVVAITDDEAGKIVEALAAKGYAPRRFGPMFMIRSLGWPAIPGIAKAVVAEIRSLGSRR